MKNPRKLTAVLLGAALLAGNLCACQKTESQISDTSLAADESGEIVKPDTRNAGRITLSKDSVKITGSGVTEKDGVITITEEGTYVVSGTLDDGRIIVNAPKKDVSVILENADITCSYGSPLYVYKSSTTTIYLTESTENTLTDGSSYTFNDSFSSSADEEPNACLYSKSDLVIAGSGSLIVNANYNNGITSKDTLNIESASITVNACNHGINGKDSCIIKNADIKVTGGGDAIRSTNDSDDELGYVTLTDSTLDLTSGEDGIQAETSILISGGSYTISAGDDGIHADKVVKITSGEINIKKCYEGIEGAAVDISGGTIEIVSDDDGINAAGGTDQSGFGKKMQDSFENLSDYYINISGGLIKVDASGDGIDSNGSLTVSGGEVYVSGPENNGNSAFDYDGTATITGGIVIAAGSAGMAQNFGEDSTQGSILLTYDSYSDSKITVMDSSDNILASYSPAKKYNCIVVSSPSLTKGNTYTVNACDQSTSVTLDELIYGQSSGKNGGGRWSGDRKRPDDFKKPDGSMPPEGITPPDGFAPPEKPSEQ